MSKSRNVQCLVDLGLQSGKLAGPIRIVPGLARVYLFDGNNDDGPLYLPSELSEYLPDADNGTVLPGAQRCILSFGKQGDNPRFHDWRDVVILNRENVEALHEQLGNILGRWK